MIRILIFLILLILFPFILFFVLLFGLTIYFLIKFGIVKPIFSFKTATGYFFKDKSQPTNEAQKTFLKTSLQQISCKHHNLEQKQAILICCDCGKIISNEH
jgi:hypothetical protein